MTFSYMAKFKSSLPGNSLGLKFRVVDAKINLSGEVFLVKFCRGFLNTEKTDPVRIPCSRSAFPRINNFDHPLEGQKMLGLNEIKVISEKYNRALLINHADLIAQ